MPPDIRTRKADDTPPPRDSADHFILVPIPLRPGWRLDARQQHVMDHRSVSLRVPAPHKDVAKEGDQLVP
jgi:hypothetical protein